MINRYINALTLDAAPGSSKTVSIEAQSHMEVTMLKELTWVYVINNPGLATQQFGQRKVVSTLFDLCRGCTRYQGPRDVSA